MFRTFENVPLHGPFTFYILAPAGLMFATSLLGLLNGISVVRDGLLRRQNFDLWITGTIGMVVALGSVIVAGGVFGSGVLLYLQPDIFRRESQASTSTALQVENLGTVSLSAPANSFPPGAATREKPYVNSLGMEFIPVPSQPRTLMCRTETRVRDFRAYVRAIGYVQSGPMFVAELKGASGENPELGLKVDYAANWESPGFAQGDDHPVVGVDYAEASSFCQWLSGREGLNYRLPTDSEWSAVVGESKFPWGTEWPPPTGAGNYFDFQAVKELYGAATAERVKGVYDDRFGWTSPVSRFGPNQAGFFDLGGNVWEWCEDTYRPSMNDAELLEEFPFLKNEKTEFGTAGRVLRGGSWFVKEKGPLRSSSRLCGVATHRVCDRGFRCVIELADRSPAASK